MKLAALLALSAFAVLTAGSLGQEILTGKAAFGDFAKDAPGVKRLIRPSDLVPPSLTRTASNAPSIVDRPAGVLPKVPPGFKVEEVATGIDKPRAIRFAPNGDLFVADSWQGQVRILHFAQPGASRPDGQGVFAQGLNRPYGIAFYPPDHPQWIYVAVRDGLKRFPYKAGDRKAQGKGETILSGIPASYHWTRDVAFSPDGKTMYYSVASGSNVGLDGTMRPTPGRVDVAKWAASHPLGVAWGGEEGRAAVFALNPDGTNKRYFGTGLRNCSGIAVQPATGEVWCVVNERDELGDDVPFDFATPVRDGGFYGWPWYYIGDNPDPRWRQSPRQDLKGKVAVPEVLFQAHSAPLNIVFYNSDAWGPEYKGAAFVTMHGSWNRDSRTGYKVVKLEMDENGKPTGVYEDFMTGFVVNQANVWGRPVGVAVGPDGSLFVSDDGSGTIWKVSKVE